MKERQVTKSLEQKRHENRLFNMFHSPAYRQNERKHCGKGLKIAQSNIPTENIVKKVCAFTHFVKLLSRVAIQRAAYDQKPIFS